MTILLLGFIILMIVYYSVNYKKIDFYINDNKK